MTGKVGPLGGSPGILLPPDTPTIITFQDQQLGAGNASSFSAQTFMDAPKPGRRRVVIAYFAAGFGAGLVNLTTCTINGVATVVQTFVWRTGGAGGSIASLAIAELLQDQSSVANPTVAFTTIGGSQDSLGFMTFTVDDANGTPNVATPDSENATPWSGTAWPTKRSLVVPMGSGILCAGLANVDGDAAAGSPVGFGGLASQLFDASHNVKVVAAIQSNAQPGGRDYGFSINDTGSANKAAGAVYAVWA